VREKISAVESRALGFITFVVCAVPIAAVLTIAVSQFPRRVEKLETAAELAFVIALALREKHNVCRITSRTPQAAAAEDGAPRGTTMPESGRRPGEVERVHDSGPARSPNGVADPWRRRCSLHTGFAPRKFNILRFEG
jgi:hypothetical protein